MKSAKLQDLTHNITDGKHGDCQNEEGSGYYFISCKDVKDERINYDCARQITFQDFTETHKRTQLEEDDFLITNSGTIGRMAFIINNEFLERTTFQKSVAIVKVNKEKIIPKYLYYNIKTNINKLIREANGAAQKNLLLSSLRNFSIKYHDDVTHQRFVVSVLSSYDSLIENNKKQIKLLEEAAQRLYKEWFVNLRFPGHENVKIVDGVPEGWRQLKISDLLVINPTVAQPHSDTVKYIPMSALSDSGMTIKIDVIEERATPTSVRFCYGDTLFARITPCLENGKTAIALWQEKDEVACGSSEFIVLRGEKISPWLTYLLARDEDVRGAAIGSMVGASGRQRVQLSCFDSCIFNYPPKGVLEQFDEIVEPFFYAVQKLVYQIQFATEARDRLLPKLMNGEIEV